MVQQNREAIANQMSKALSVGSSVGVYYMVRCVRLEFPDGSCIDINGSDLFVDFQTPNDVATVRSISDNEKD